MFYILIIEDFHNGKFHHVAPKPFLREKDAVGELNRLLFEARRKFRKFDTEKPVEGGIALFKKGDLKSGHYIIRVEPVDIPGRTAVDLVVGDKACEEADRNGIGQAIKAIRGGEMDGKFEMHLFTSLWDARCALDLLHVAIGDDAATPYRGLVRPDEKYRCVFPVGKLDGRPPEEFVGDLRFRKEEDAAAWLRDQGLDPDEYEFVEADLRDFPEAIVVKADGEYENGMGSVSAHVLGLELDKAQDELRELVATNAGEKGRIDFDGPVILYESPVDLGAEGSHGDVIGVVAIDCQYIHSDDGRKFILANVVDFDDIENLSAAVSLAVSERSRK